MKNKKIWVVMLVIALAFSFMFTGCAEEDDPLPGKGSGSSSGDGSGDGSGSGDGGSNPSVNVFNGTWISVEDDYTEKLILNENVFEVYADDVKQVKGTIAFGTPTAAQPIPIILTVTHVSAEMEGLSDFLEIADTDIDIPTDWINKDDLTSIINIVIQSLRDSDISIEDLFGDEFENIDDFEGYVMEMIDEMFFTITGTALPGTDGSNLTLTITYNLPEDESQTTVYTKQP